MKNLKNIRTVLEQPTDKINLELIDNLSELSWVELALAFSLSRLTNERLHEEVLLELNKRCENLKEIEDFELIEVLFPMYSIEENLKIHIKDYSISIIIAKMISIKSPLLKKHIDKKMQDLIKTGTYLNDKHTREEVFSNKDLFTVSTFNRIERYRAHWNLNH